jgi:Uncharacterized small protein
MKDMHIHTHDSSPDIRTTLLEAIKGIRYGSVEIIIHDSKVVQIERKEKVRIATTNLH